MRRIASKESVRARWCRGRRIGPPGKRKKKKNKGRNGPVRCTYVIGGVRARARSLAPVYPPVRSRARARALPCECPFSISLSLSPSLPFFPSLLSTFLPVSLFFSICFLCVLFLRACVYVRARVCACARVSTPCANVYYRRWLSRCATGKAGKKDTARAFSR